MMVRTQMGPYCFYFIFCFVEILLRGSACIISCISLPLYQLFLLSMLRKCWCFFLKFHFQLNSLIVSTFNEGNDSAIFSTRLKSFVFIGEFFFFFVLFGLLHIVTAFLSDSFILLYDLSVQSCIFAGISFSQSVTNQTLVRNYFD